MFFRSDREGFNYAPYQYLLYKCFAKLRNKHSLKQSKARLTELIVCFLHNERAAIHTLFSVNHKLHQANPLSMLIHLCIKPCVISASRKAR